MVSQHEFARRDDSGNDAVVLAFERRESAIDSISVEIETGPGAAALARGALDALSPRVDDEVLNDVRLLVSELVTNSVRHSHADGAEHVGLDVEVRERRLRVEVSDGGSGFEPRPRTAGQSQGSGWGLYLVDRLAERWGVSNEGRTRVWFEMSDPTVGGEAFRAA